MDAQICRCPDTWDSASDLSLARWRRRPERDKFCETQRMARTDDEKWLVVDGRRGRRTEPAYPADALDDSRRQDQER